MARRFSRLNGGPWGAWAAFVFWVIVLVAWAPIALAPSVATARRIGRTAARAWFRATATPLHVRGREHLDALRGPCVFVANHSSSLDAIVATAALPPRFGFVAKAELEGVAWIRPALRRLGVLFVRRSGPKPRGGETARAVERLRRGESLLFYPEGTFGRDAQLRPFHRGAFVAAALAGACVVPLAVRGTRDMLPNGCRIPRRGAIAVEIGRPLEAPRGDDAAASAAALRRLAEHFIARRVTSSRRCAARSAAARPAARAGSR